MPGARPARLYSPGMHRGHARTGGARRTRDRQVNTTGQGMPMALTGRSMRHAQGVHGVRAGHARDLHRACAGQSMCRVCAGQAWGMQGVGPAQAGQQTGHASRMHRTCTGRAYARHTKGMLNLPFLEICKGLVPLGLRFVAVDGDRRPFSSDEGVGQGLGFDFGEAEHQNTAVPPADGLQYLNKVVRLPVVLDHLHRLTNVVVGRQLRNAHLVMTGAQWACRRRVTGCVAKGIGSRGVMRGVMGQKGGWGDGM